MSGTLAWTLAALGLLLIVMRRRSVAVGLVTVQALILVAYAAHQAAHADDIAAASALGVRGLALGALFLFLVKRTRETRPVRARIAPLTRAALAVTFALTLTWLVPSLGLESRAAERAVLALVAIGITTVATRRATLFQIIGIVLVENALALAALELPGGASLAIELGVALDLILVALVAGVFHERIFLEFGAGDTAALRTLRD